MTYQPLVRKDVAYLSETEKQNFIRAVLKCKADGTYDQLALIHVRLLNLLMSPRNGNEIGSEAICPHQCPIFLPWHRELCKRFEYNLQCKDISVTLPYWNWARDATLPNPADSILWTDDFMGGNGDPQDGYIVKTGPFAYDPSEPNSWQLVDPESGKPAGGLRRAFGIALTQIGRSPTLPTQADVNASLGIAAYDYPNWDTDSSPSFRNTLEGWLNGPKLHNQVQMYIGGTSATNMSAFDPVFFLHHCNVDRIWAEWQAMHPNAYMPTGTIIDIQGNKIPGQDINDLTYPWKDRTIGFNLDHSRNLLYNYDTLQR
jgi:tyrosinase